MAPKRTETANEQTRERGEPRPLALKNAFKRADSKSPVGKLTWATVAEWNAQKHRKPSAEEIELIDSLFRGCPYAAAGDGVVHDCVKYGATGLGVQRYLCKGCGRQFAPITFVAGRYGHDQRYAIDPHKANVELNWDPVTTFEEGIKKTIKWYDENQWWLDECTSGEYKNWLEKNYKNRK